MSSGGMTMQVSKTFAKNMKPLTHQFDLQSTAPKTALNRIKQELRQKGAVAYDLRVPEVKYLPSILRPDEHIMGSVFGKHDQGRGVLIATDQRVLFVDKKPLFLHVDEVTYALVGGVTFTKSLLSGYVTLHTRVGDYKLRTFNFKNAANFVDFIEARCVEAGHLSGDIYVS